MTTEQQDHNQTDINEQVIEKVAPGTLLKQKREDLGLTQRQVADRLRLRLSIIQSIEENRFEDGQVATFTRGYLRSYAKAVGIRESDILCAFDDSYCQQPPTQPDMKSFSKKTKRQLHDTRIMIITWVVFAVIVGMSTLWWWQNSQKNSLIPPQMVIEPTTTPDAQPVEEENIANEEFATVPPLNDLQNSAPPSEETPLMEEPQPTEGNEQAPSTSNEAEVTTEAPVVVETTAVAPPVVQPEVVSTTPAAPAAQAEPEVSSSENVSAPLVLNFSADCWIQVKDATGKTLSTGVKTAGQSISLNGLRPYKVVLGAPEGVSITLASEPVDLSGYTSGKVARLTLP
ncbi:cytoskeleton protein RodZ [Vibrio sp. AH4]|uniref:cytoskeleton protein RodZ n=1 Tax=Vibrio sp. AH4 TaxID=2919577 RepID=UPI002739764F|nr:cytoskeleton protein RodZ [Vibrio sp. AH4]MDP4492270.1 cytoskeleton protein RodZ [Vibrio sp. AH4]